MRKFSNGNVFRTAAGPAEPHEDVVSKSPAQMDAIVRQARLTFGDTLPKDFLTSEEYQIYERLYGPPTHDTRAEDIRLLQPLEDDPTGDEDNVIDDADQGESEIEPEEYEDPEAPEDIASEKRVYSVDEEANKEFKARMMLSKDIAAAYQAAELVETNEEEAAGIEEVEEVQAEYVPNEEIDQEYDQDRDPDGIDDSDSAYHKSEGMRTHPLTAAGRFDTFPATLQIPKTTVIDPITAILANASNKHLTEIAKKTFGGPLLPNSTATPTGSKGHLKQQSIALDATQSRMGEMEANAYLAAITPGIYASVTSALVEIRKRLGPEWIQDLLQKRGGPSILDVGGAGAGVLAWRDLLHAEWELLHPNGVPIHKSLTVGKSTIVVGSTSLRSRISRLLDNTIFLPRLPEYNPTLDHPSIENQGTDPKKQFDLIVAPHSLWRFKEDHQRKRQVQHYWSLLNPKGGVLLIMEKGVPKGFEFVAGAREVLLKHHIASPGSEMAENRVEEPFHARFREKEAGMIIAPCTNHLKCPMYLTSGQNKGRKDHCHFSQRYVRPHFLQRILGGRDRNHEDIRFSYVAVQRGIDQRQTSGILQGKEATDAAFEGYEVEEPGDAGPSNELSQPAESSVSKFHTLSLPRAILPPIKRHGHIILDLCTPRGQVERWTVPKSFGKQAFRDARKSKWGDLWALGAKTRIPRNLRLGIKNRQAEGKNVMELENDEMQQTEMAKRTRKGRKPKLTEPVQDTL